MKASRATLLLLVSLASGSGFAQQASARAENGQSGEAAAPAETPAQQKLASAQQQIREDPKKVQAYTELALACVRRNRETADPKYLKDAEAALAQGLALDPRDFQLQKAQVALMLAHHKYAQARERATALNHQIPDDVMIYGFLAEADIALGNYPEAEKSTQWMLNLRANNIPGLLAGAELRSLYGDAHGAIQFLSLAYTETSPTESEDLAWIANRIAAIQIASGQIEAAAQTLEAAEKLFHPYLYTTENRARVRAEQNRAGDAVQLWKSAAQLDPNPDVVYQLARAEEAAGQSVEARATYSQFEKLAGDPEKATIESTRDLVFLYAADPATAANAMKLARQEVAARQDVWTLDAYAWALYANADFSGADAAEQKAIAVGIQSAQIFDHAGHIAQKLNRGSDATKYFQLAVRADIASEYAVDALKSAGASIAADSHREQAPSADLNPLQSTANASPAPSQAGSQRPANSPRSVDAAAAMATPTFPPVPEALLVPKATATDRLIHSAQGTVERNPADPKAYAALGAAYFQRARETGDVSDYQLSEQSLTKSLDLLSTDFSADAALGTMSEVCMGEHRFADALAYSQKALSLGTGDVSPFAIVGDAYADMGEYAKASDAYARLTPRDMTLAPRAAYARDSRLSYLKFIAGDTPGAIDLMKTAVAEGVEAQLPSENLAWLYYELGEYSAQAGDAASADSAYMTALTIHPGDYRALAALGKLRANNGRYAEAIVLYQKAIAVVPMPIFVAELGDLYAKSGNASEAKKQYALVEYIGLLGHINQVLHNRDLAIFYADHDMKLAESLDLAQKELEVRHDVYTWDALAWALYKNGKLDEAAKASENATRYGTRDALLLFHAAMIADKLGRADQARSEMKQALAINPHFHLIYAETAQQQLTAWEGHSESKEGSEKHGR
jgi:predicted Zn-dependent protease